MFSLGILGLMTGLNQWAISPKMVALRAAMELPIDRMAKGDPRVVAFDNLHKYSVASLTIAMVAALIAFLLIARAER
jgi:hypothetical protein